MNPLALLFIKTLPEPTPEEQLATKLAERKAIRLAEQKRATDAYWKAERRRHANDPLIRRGTERTPATTSLEGHCPNSALPGFDA